MVLLPLYKVRVRTSDPIDSNYLIVFSVDCLIRSVYNITGIRSSGTLLKRKEERSCSFFLWHIMNIKNGSILSFEMVDIPGAGTYYNNVTYVTESVPLAVILSL